MKKTSLALAFGSGLALTSALALAFGAQQPSAGQTAVTAAVPVNNILWSSTAATVPTVFNGTSGVINLNNGGSIVSFTPLPTAPAGAVYHQMVDRYFDAGGKVVEVSSKTHAVRGDCHPGRREQGSELIAQDDGKGNVIFADGVTELGGSQDLSPLVRMEVEQRASVVALNKKVTPATAAEPQLASVR